MRFPNWDRQIFQCAPRSDRGLNPVAEMGWNGIAMRVCIFLRGSLYGVLAPMTKPVWCAAALRDGPLAKRLAAQVLNPKLAPFEIGGFTS